MKKDDLINIKNFEREIKLRQLLEEQKNSEFTEEFPLKEIMALSIEGLQIEINKIKKKYDS
jgi:hypothetical protein